MDYIEFKVQHSELIMYCQIIENDLKWIYSFMHKGKPNQTRNQVSDLSLGQIVKELKYLDGSDGVFWISEETYDFLLHMSKARNYWCHQCYIDFVYNKEGWDSKEYEDVCKKLKKQHDRFKEIFEQVEQRKLIIAQTR